MTTPSSPVASFTGADATEDEVGATAVIRALCGWHIADEITETRVVDCDGDRILPLPTLHLTGVSAVAATDPDAVGTPLDLSAVRWSERGMLWLPTWWPAGFRAMTVTISHGFALVPQELAVATRSIARHLEVPEASSAPASSYTVTQGDVTRTKTLAVSAAAALVGGLSFVERLILARYALGPLP